MFLLFVFPFSSTVSSFGTAAIEQWCCCIVLILETSATLASRITNNKSLTLIWLAMGWYNSLVAYASSWISREVNIQCQLPMLLWSWKKRFVAIQNWANTTTAIVLLWWWWCTTERQNALPNERPTWDCCVWMISIIFWTPYDIRLQWIRTKWPQGFHVFVAAHTVRDPNHDGRLQS